jgi:recombinational DNA repair ATPase RecF
MPIRIETIKINQAGPLKQNFIFKPGDLNLIYGPNETGKSYLLEAIISLLFKTGSRSAADWQLRDWDYSGNIQVSGLGDSLETFTMRSRKKLEDYWQEQSGLPQDFSKLLVIKEGESMLFDYGEPSRTFLKNYLSGEGLLDGIQEGVPITVQNAEIADGIIKGNNQGEIRQQREWLKKRNELKKLLSQAQTQYASGRLSELEETKLGLEGKIETLEKAKKYHAFVLSQQIHGLRQEAASLPNEELLTSLSSKISVYAREKTKLESDQVEAQKLGGSKEKYDWAEKARGVYIQATSKIAAKPSWFLFWFSIALLAGGLASGIMGFEPGLIAGCGLATLLLVYYFFKLRKVMNTVGSSREIELVKKEFQQKFGSEFCGLTTIDVAIGQLSKSYNRFEILQEGIREGEVALKQQTGEINSELREYCGEEVLPEEWEESTRRLRRELREKTDLINEKNNALIRLGVREEHFLADDPGIEWSTESYSQLKEQDNQLHEQIIQERDNLRNLQQQIASTTGSGSDNFVELFDQLQDLYEDTNAEYLQKTAGILAGITVNQVVKEFKLEEDKRIAEGLASSELAKPLYEITSHYNGMVYDADEGLILLTEDGYHYPLDMLSTGAREQVFIAMRVGFAQIAMKNQTAFMILDDAFQHSDWRRRTNLVECIAELATSSWQIFYFTMDDHIRDLVKRASEKFKGDFKYLELA